MATDSARSNSPSPARHLWQVPALLIGVAALIAVLVTRPSAPDTIGAAEQQLQEARKALEQVPPDPSTAVQKADRVLAVADRYPQLAGEAHFLAGSARLRLGDDPSADAGRERNLARQHLEQAATLGVAEADQPKLNYRLAKVGMLLGGDPAKVASLLEKSVDADDPAEGYGLLAVAYTRQNPPDLPKALEAAKQQLDRTLRSGDARAQAIARFRLGELYLKLKKDKEARQMLAKVSVEAPPEMYHAARTMLAESYEGTQAWADAARNWQVARDNPQLAAPEKAKVLYHLGWCDARAQIKEAAAVFEETIALGGPEGQAAGIRLAELKLDAEPAAAITVLATALQSAQGPADYRNPLIAIDDVRALIETIIQKGQEKSNWELCRQAIEVYGRVAVTGRDDELAGQAFAAQGDALAEKVKSDAAQATTIEEQSRDAYRNAAAAYERAAGKIGDPPLQGVRLWQAAKLALKSGQPVRSRDILTRATQIDGALAPEKTAEAWLMIGNTDHLNQHAADARAAYLKCLTLPGPYALKARLGLAKIDLAEHHFDEAEQGLQDVLKAVRELSAPDADLQEQALFTWAEAAYYRQSAVKDELREYLTAENRLEGAIKQYPDGPAAVRARHMLGLCYWNDARLKSRALDRGAAGSPTLSPDERAAYQRQKTEFLRKSAEQYEKVEELMLARERADGRLAAEEAKFLKEAGFWASDCYFWMGNYEEAVRRYGVLALRYQGRPEEMIALSQLWQSYGHMGQPEKVTALVARMQETLPKIPDTAFDGRLDTHRRDFWVNWLREITKPPVPPAVPTALPRGTTAK
jgi:TolA-binding protein